MPSLNRTFVDYTHQVTDSAKDRIAIKKALKITCRLLGVLVVAVLTGVILLQTPSVQTWAVQRIEKKLLEGTSGEIGFEKIHLKPFNTLIIKNAAIIDAKPFIPDTSTREDLVSYAPVDTVARAGYICARFTLRGLVSKNGILLSDVKIKDLEFNLVVEPGRTNIQRIFTDRRDRIIAGNAKKGTTFKFRHATLENGHFRMYNVKDWAPAWTGYGVNWGDTDVYDIKFEGKDISIEDGYVKAALKNLSFKEKSGLVCRNMSAKAVIGGCKVAIEKFHYEDICSTLDLPYFIMTLDDPLSLRKFVGEVRMDAEIEPSRLNLGTVGYYAGVPDLDAEFDISGRLSGQVKDFSFSDLRLRTPSGDVCAKLSGSVKGLPAIKKSWIDIDIDRLDATTSGLDKLLASFMDGKQPGISRFAPDERIVLKTCLKGKLNNLKADIDLNSTLGDLYADAGIRHLTDSAKAIRIMGRIRSEDLDLGKLTGVKKLGPLSMRSYLHATLGKSNPSLTIDSLMISRLNFNGYDYSKIAAVGTVSQRAFNGKIISQDPSLNFLFQGLFALSRKTRNAAYQFYANVGHADLHAMNFDSREVSDLSFRTSANFNRTASGEVLGNIDVRGLQLTGEDGKHDIGDILISSHSNDDIHRASLSSSFAEGSFVSSAPIASFFADLIGLTLRREIPALMDGNGYKFGENRSTAALTFLNSVELTSFIKPGLYIENGTEIKVGIDRKGNVDGLMSSGRIALKDKYIKDLEFSFNNLSDSFGGSVDCKEISLGSLSLADCKLNASANDNMVNLGLSFLNDETAVLGRGEIEAEGQVLRDADGKPGLKLLLKPSSLTVDSREWALCQSEIGIHGSSMLAKGIRISDGTHAISLDGGYSKEKSDTLGLRFESFGLDMVNAFAGPDNPLELDGVLSGDVRLTSGSRHMGILADLVCEGTRVSGSELGRLDIRSGWDDTFKRYVLHLGNDIQGRQSIGVNGTITPGAGLIDLDMQLDSLDVGFATPLLKDVFSDMRGYVSGHVKAEGEATNFILRSEGMRFDETLLKVDYTNVTYRADGDFHLDEYGVYFDNVELLDQFGSSGRVSGGIHYDHFKDMNFDLGVSVRRMELIDIPENRGEGFYGNLYGSGNVAITGPADAIGIDVNANTSGVGKGRFYVPLTAAAAAKQADLLSFREPERVIVIDPYEEMMSKLKQKEKKSATLSVHVKASATPDVEAILEIDPIGGSGLNGRGNGEIEISVTPNKPFDIKGDYTISEGNFKYVVLGIASRDFSITNGSSIKFGGDIMESTLDIDAVYKTKTSLSTLISDTTSVNTRRNVECGIRISDKLRNPSIGFSINVPDLDPTVKSKVDNALSTEDKVQKQFLSLIISNSFLPDEQSGIVNNSSVLYSNVSEIMAGQLNNILERLDIPVDLGLNYQPNTKGNDVFDVAISTQLFNNRVVVNGNIGNRQYKTSTSNSNVVGDLDIEVKLDRPGALRLKLFSHSADQYTSFLDNSQRNGVGLTFQQEFNRLKELLRRLFAPKAEKAEMDLKEQQRLQQEGVKTILIDE